MRILFVTNQYPTPETPGDGPALAQQRDALVARGHEVDVFWFNSVRNRWLYLSSLPRVAWRAGVRHRYDVVHAHYGSWCGWVARMQWRSPLLVTFRGSDVLAPAERPATMALRRWIDGAVVMSEEMRRSLGRPDAEVVPYGIDTGLFHPGDRAAARAALGLDPDAPLVLFPYSPHRPEKRFDLVTAAMEKVRAELPDAQLLALVGQPHERVATHMQACDALVLASDTEGSPVAVREALACALPVVSVDVGDVAEVLGPIQPGNIVGRDPAQIADRLIPVLRSRERLSDEVAASVFSVDQAAERVEAIYRRLARVPGPA